jgi:general secretion pathway protein L
MQIVLGRLTIGRLPTLRRFGDWWLKEFLDLLPDRIVELLSGRGQMLLVITADQEGATLELLNQSRALMASERTTPMGNALPEIDRFLQSHGLERNATDIGLRLPAESFFSKQLLLPAEAINTIEAIVAQDIAKKTPFKSADIYSDHVALERDDGNKVAVWQWIIRRQFVDKALLSLNMAVEQLAFVMADSRGAHRPVPFINLRPKVHVGNSLYQRIALVLCCSAFILALLAGGLKYWNQQIAIDRLAAQIATTGAKAQQVRALVDQLQEKKRALLHLRLQRNEAPGLIDLWEEVTRVLPSHSWLSELRFVETAGKREEQVIMSGFSGAAPSLVGIIDSSPLFFDAALTSPIALDVIEGRERFALQAKVKMPDAFRQAAR